ncbi:MAG: VOC family protein [Hyphomonadaceae bacterium]|nr:VOC family protein [Clostridia bacterium]
MITGVEHIALCSTDTAALKDWYMQVMGFRQVYDNGKGTYFLMMQSGAMLEFISASEDGGKQHERVSGIRHIALNVDDFDSTVAGLLDAGVEVLTEAMVSPQGIKTFFFKDPDGNILHLIDRPTPLG